YAARRFYAPVLVSPVAEGGNVRVYVVSDRLSNTRARLTLRLVDLQGNGKDGGELWRSERDIVIKANSSEVQFSAAERDLLQGKDPRRVVLGAELSQTAGAGVATTTSLGRNLLFFAKARDLELPVPGIQAQIEAAGAGATVRVTAQRFARAVWLTTTD